METLRQIKSLAELSSSVDFNSQESRVYIRDPIKSTKYLIEAFQDSLSGNNMTSAHKLIVYKFMDKHAAFEEFRTTKFEEFIWRNFCNTFEYKEAEEGEILLKYRKGAELDQLILMRGDLKITDPSGITRVISATYGAIHINKELDTDPKITEGHLIALRPELDSSIGLEVKEEDGMEICAVTKPTCYLHLSNEAYRKFYPRDAERLPNVQDILNFYKKRVNFFEDFDQEPLLNLAKASKLVTTLSKEFVYCPGKAQFRNFFVNFEKFFWVIFEFFFEFFLFW